ncbi:zinc finger protein 703-like [Engraulis encrasicolus]|uniref:zinc finger protein 703-like n=1 Tax=Engraulis encrasicolus TaxID=184585 RepID=UPI002FD1769E
MKDFLTGSKTHCVRHLTPDPTIYDCEDSCNSPKSVGIQSTLVSTLTPLDPIRQAKRLPIRILKMLTAHSHLLHPEYLQPLTSAAVSIELDAKKSPLALLAQTCSQIGKPDPPPNSKLGSISSGGHSDKEPSSRSSSSSLKLGEHRPVLEDKSSFKPYAKVGSTECRRDGVSSTSNSSSNNSGGSDKVGFRVPHSNNNSSNSTGCSSFPPHSVSPNSRVNSGSPPQTHGALSSHRQTQSPSSQTSIGHSHMLNGDHKGADSTNSDSASSKKTEAERESSKSTNHDAVQLANSSHGRASVNSSTGSSVGSPHPHHDSKSDSQSSQPGGGGSSLGHGHITPISPFKSGHSVFPLPSSGMGYHGSIVGAYAGYPSGYMPTLDPTKTSSLAGVPGKHPSSSPLTGASPPSFMQGLCRDPYCLSYPGAHHLGGGSGCNTTCIHDPTSSSSALKPGFPLVYPGHPLHSLHAGALTSSMTPTTLSHPLYTYGFVLPNDPLPHACNWVSAGVGPCDKRFGTSEELLAHLRTHTTSLPSAAAAAAAASSLDSQAKLLSSAYPGSSAAAAAAAAAAACHLHLPQSSPSSMPSSFSLRAPPSLGLARYHPYGKVPLPAAAAHTLPMHSLQAGAPYYSHYALYGQRLGSASALGYQ